MLTTDTRNGNSSLVPAIGAERDLHFAAFGKVSDERCRCPMASDWFVLYGTHHHQTRVAFHGGYLVDALECQFEIVAMPTIEDR